MDKSTERPWTHENDSIMKDPITNKPKTGFRIYQKGYLVGELYHMDESDKDKVLIAVNSHDALVEACEEALRALNAESELNEGLEIRNRRRIAIIRQALKLAKGQNRMKEKRAYVCSCKNNFDFRAAEMIRDYEAIKEHALKTGQVYSLEEFQDALNEESLSLENAFVLID